MSDKHRQEEEHSRERLKAHVRRSVSEVTTSVLPIHVRMLVYVSVNGKDLQQISESMNTVHAVVSSRHWTLSRE
jgi:hypothetical protein